MTTFDQAVRAVQQHGAQFQTALRSWVAYLGDGAGNVVSDTAKNRYFCRYPASDSPSSEVYAAGCPPVDGMRVMVGYSADQSKLVRILSWTDPALENTIFPLQRHGNTHSYLQGDTTWIDWRQILTLKVQPYSGLIVYVNGGVLPRSGVDLYVLPQIVDMSGSVPNTIGEGRYALLSLDPSGTVVITNGTPITPGMALDISNVPNTPSGNFRLAAVQLVYGQTTIEETTSRCDILDLRWPQETIAGNLAPGSIGGATAQYQYLVSGAGPTYTAQWSNGYLAITSGKTLTAQNNLTLSGTDGKALTLTGSLTIGADTSITGGGTIGLGGFTLTVSGNSTVNGSLVGNMTGGGTVATGGFTLTIPATGTAALINYANVFSQIQTIGSSSSYVDYLLVLNGSHPGTGDAGIKLFPDNTGAHGSSLIDFWNDAGLGAPAYARIGRNVSSGGTALFTGPGGAVANAFQIGTRDASVVELFTADNCHFLLDSTGKLQIGNIASGGIFSSIGVNITAPTDATIFAYSGQLTGLSASVLYGGKFQTWYNGGNDSSMSVRGFNSLFQVTAPPTGKTYSASMMAANYQLDVAGDVGVVSDVRGVNIALSNTLANVTQMYAVRARFGNVSGNIDNVYGVYLDPFLAAGTIGQAFGLFIQPITQGWAANRAIQAMGGESYHAGNFGFGNNGSAFSAATLLHGIGTTTTNNAALEIERIEARVSTASTGGAAGFGPALTFYGESATDGNYRQMLQIDAQWSTATDASRKARSVWSVFDTAAREVLRGYANGSLGLLGVGLGADPAAILHVGASATGAASLRIPAGTAPTAPAEGDKWNDSTQKADIAFLAGISQARVGCIYSSYADVTVSGTASETTLLGGSAKGTLTLPANFWTIGKKIRIRGGGIHSMPGGSPTMQIRLYLGSVLIGDTTALVDKNDTNTAHSFDYQVTCITTGATGTVKCTGFMLHHEGTVDVNMWPFENTGTATIDTTAAMTVNLTSQVSTSTGTSVTASNMTIEVLE